jgi:hypothetical protein
MENFFGINTGSSFYDKRRHLNCVFQFLLGNLDRGTLGEIFKTFQTQTTKITSQQTKFKIAFTFSNASLRCLDFISEDLSLTDDENMKIFGLIDILNPEIKSPAGYKQAENKKLLVHLLFMSCFIPQNSRNNAITNYVGGILKPFFTIDYIVETFNTLISVINQNSYNLMHINKNDFNAIVSKTLIRI